MAALAAKAGFSSDLNLMHTNGLWRVLERGDYLADYQRIRDLLFKIKDVKVAQSERIGPSQLGRVDLDEPGTGTGSGNGTPGSIIPPTRQIGGGGYYGGAGSAGGFGGVGYYGGGFNGAFA